MAQGVQRGLHIDALSGMAGDMFMAALIDCGLDLEQLRLELSKLPLSNFRIECGEVKRGPFRALQARVLIRAKGDEGEQEEGRHQAHQGHSHAHGMGFCEIVDLIREAHFSTPSEVRAIAIFETIARAEAKVHGSTLEAVHFHEVGAIDSIVDVCAAALAIELMGISRVTCSAIGVGHGTRRMAHGEVPIPAPATAEIICGLPICQTQVKDELLTPTGAAILRVLVDEFLPNDSVVFESVGYGAGSADRADPPNVVRARLFRTSIEDGEEQGRETVAVLETQIDDCSGELMGHARQLLEDAGALDVLIQSVQMKKNRPGFLLTVIARPEHADNLQEIMLTSTTSFGVRKSLATRKILDRQVVTVETPIGGARVKLGMLNGNVVHVSPEHVDCARLAQAAGIPLGQVMRMVESSYRHQT